MILTSLFTRGSNHVLPSKIIYTVSCMKTFLLFQLPSLKGPQSKSCQKTSLKKSLTDFSTTTPTHQLQKSQKSASKKSLVDASTDSPTRHPQKSRKDSTSPTLHHPPAFPHLNNNSVNTRTSLNNNYTTSGSVAEYYRRAGLREGYDPFGRKLPLTPAGI